MRRLIGLTIVAVALICFSVNPVWADRPFPQCEGFLTDFANVISTEYRKKLFISVGEMGTYFGVGVLIVTMPDIGGAELNDYANRLSKAWKLDSVNEYGRAVLIFVTVKERKISIVTGYGIKGVLPDALVTEIIHRDMTPCFKENHFGEGLLHGIVAISHIVAKEAAPVPLQKQAVTSQETAPSLPVKGSVQKLPDGWYQIPFVTDDATGTVFWLHAPDPQLSCGSSMPATEVFGVAPKSVSFLDDQQSRRLILAGGLPLVQWAVQRCGGAPWADVWIMHQDYQLLRGQPRQNPMTPWIYYRDLQQHFCIGPIAVNGRVFYEYQASKISLGNIINFVQQANTQRQEIKAMAKKQTEVKKLLDTFLRKYEVGVWLDSKEMGSQFVSNPFQWKGKIIGLVGEFGGMLSEDSGFFAANPNLLGPVLIVMKKLPSARFTRTGDRFFLAGRVQGMSQVQLPGLFGNMNVNAPELSFVGAEPAPSSMPR